MNDHSTNGQHGQNLITLEAREIRRSFESLVARLGTAWDYDGRGPTLCGSFALGDGPVCSDRCLIELAGRTAPASGIHPHLEVCDGEMALTLTPELGSDSELSLAALRFALDWDGLMPSGLEG